MDSNTIAMSLTFGSVLVVFTYIGWTYRTNDNDLFHTANRSASNLRIVSSLFTIVGASEFLVFSTIVYIYGIYSLFFFLGTLLGFLCLSYFSDRIRVDAAEKNMHSIPDIIADNGYKLPALLMSGFCFGFTIILTIIQAIIGGLLISSITGVDFIYASAGMCVCVWAYLLWGGYQALLNTDIVQAVIMVGLTFGLTAYLLNGIDILAIINTHGFISTHGIKFDIFVLMLGGFFAILGGPEIWQRVLTAKTDEGAKSSLKASAFLMFLWGASIVLISMLIKELLPTGQNPEQALFDFLLGSIPSWLLGITVVLLLAAIISTSDTELFAASIIAHKELLRGRTDSRMRIRGTRVMITLMSVGVFIASLATQDIISYYFSLVYITFITGPVAILILYKRGNSLTINTSMILSGLILCWIVFEGLITSLWPLLILLPFVIPLLVNNKKVAL